MNRIEKIKKEICKVFANNNLHITIKANKKVVNFLDVTLDLTTEKYKRYLKPTTIPLYMPKASISFQWSSTTLAIKKHCRKAVNFTHTNVDPTATAITRTNHQKEKETEEHDMVQPTI